MYSGSPITCKGNVDSRSFLASSSCRYGSIIELLIVEGAMQLQRILYCPYSTAMLLVNIIAPAFVTAYTERGTRGIDLMPSTDEMLTILPPPFFIIIGITVLVILNMPKRLVLTSSSH